MSFATQANRPLFRGKSTCGVLLPVVEVLLELEVKTLLLSPGSWTSAGSLAQQPLDF